MSQEPAAPTLPEQPPLNLYKVLALAALLALTMALLEKQMGLLSFLPACFGLLGVLADWRTAPMLVLASLVLAIPVRAAGFLPSNLEEYRMFMGKLSHGGLAMVQRIDPIPDFLACAALLAYMAGYFRFKGVEKNLFPQDPRKPAPAGPGPLAKASEKRPLQLVQGSEIILLLASVPIWCGLAALGLFWLVRTSGPLGLFPQFLHGPLLLLWLGGFILAILAAVLGFKAVTEAEPEENLQYLQDQVWRQTRREQARINRWFTWARLRGQRRKEAK